MLKPAGGSCVASQWAMAAAGEVCVSSSDTDSPGSASTSALTTSSARPWDEVPSTKKRASRSIHTHIAPCLVKAMGSRSSLASSFSSLLSFLPGLRPVSCSMRAAFSATRRASTEPGSTLDSTMKRSTHWPPTDSASGPWASPRGGTQPQARSCVAPHSMNGALASAASTCSRPICHCGAMRYTIMFLNIDTFSSDGGAKTPQGGHCRGWPRGAWPVWPPENE